MWCPSPANPPGPPAPPCSSGPPLVMQTARITPLKKHHSFPFTSVCVPVPCCCCLGPSVGFIFTSIHGLHNPVLVVTEHLLLLHVPVWECCCDTCYAVHGRKTNKTKQSVSVHSRVEHILFSHSATLLIGH